MKEYKNIVDYIVDAKDLIKLIVMCLCRSFNSKIFRKIPKYCDDRFRYMELEYDKEVPEYDLYKAVMTTDNRDRAIEMLKLLKHI